MLCRGVFVFIFVHSRMEWEGCGKGEDSGSGQHRCRTVKGALHLDKKIPLASMNYILIIP